VPLIWKLKSKVAAANRMDVSSANDVLTYSVMSVPSADEWSNVFVAEDTTVNRDTFNCLSSQSATHVCYASHTVDCYSGSLVSDGLLLDGADSCLVGSSLTVPHCWSNLNAVHKRTESSSVLPTSLATDNLSSCDQSLMSTVMAKDEGSSAALNGMSFP